MVALDGPPMAGKSTVLRALAERLDGRTVLTLDIPLQRSAPQRFGFGGIADDAAGVVLASAAAQLRSIEPRLPDVIIAPDRSWDDKVEAVRAAVESAANAGGCTLLVDGPIPSEMDSAFASIFSLHTKELLRTLLTTPKVSCVLARGGSLGATRRVAVKPVAVPSVVLDPGQWNGLGPSADLLGRASSDAPLSDYSPLELRLAVAAIHAGESPARLAAERPRTRQLVHMLFERLGEAGTELRRVLGRLAVLRTDFPTELLEAAGAGVLDDAARNILEHAVLFGEGNARRLHETFAREAALRGWLTSRELERFHRIAADHHRERFHSATEFDDVPAALRHEMEVFHHLSEAGDVGAIEQARCFFAAQFDALGKSLSLKRKYDAAVACYERSLERSPDDWYAHHYLAWNLDVQGKEATRVENGYLRARELARGHVWHHGRLICFYVTRSRTDSAEQAWRRARSWFGFRDEEADERFYKELHRPLARLLLHRGQLDFAGEVLDDVPASLRSDLSWFDALDRKRVGLEEAELEQVVFPPHIPVAERWEGPHLVIGAQLAGTVTHWLPGRISAIDGSSVHIRVAERDPDGSVAFGWHDYTRKAFDRLCRYARKLPIPAGTFLEIVTVGEDVYIFLHPPSRADTALPALFPRPDRYLRRASRAD